jgi:archaellum component FlaF (FlaF/FlaG flagellin family)
MYCTKADYEPMGPAVGITSNKSSWTHAKVTATYECKRNEFTSPQDIIEEKFDLCLKNNPLDPTKITDTDNSESLTENDSVDQLMPLVTYTITLKNVPNLPGATTTVGGIAVTSDEGSIGTMYSLLGRVNATNFKGASPGCMLYVGSEGSKTTSVFGPALWNLTHKFQYQPVSWNKVFSNKRGTFVACTKADGNHIYTTGDLSQLLPK